jgi:hypothetical protein
MVLEAHQLMGAVVKLLQVAVVGLLVLLGGQDFQEVARQVLVLAVFMVVVLEHLKVVHLSQVGAEPFASSGREILVNSHQLA